MEPLGFSQIDMNLEHCGYPLCLVSGITEYAVTYSMNGVPWAAINFEWGLSLGKHAVANLIYRKQVFKDGTAVPGTLKPRCP